jgi:hypothetical protein
MADLSEIHMRDASCIMSTEMIEFYKMINVCLYISSADSEVGLRG